MVTASQLVSLRRSGVLAVSRAVKLWSTPGRAIAQLQGPFNRRVDATAMEFIARWAALRGVDLDKPRRP
jgi:hypothetical protein